MPPDAFALSNLSSFQRGVNANCTEQRKYQERNLHRLDVFREVFRCDLHSPHGQGKDEENNSHAYHLSCQAHGPDHR